MQCFFCLGSVLLSHQKGSESFSQTSICSDPTADMMSRPQISDRNGSSRSLSADVIAVSHKRKTWSLEICAASCSQLWSLQSDRSSHLLQIGRATSVLGLLEIYKSFRQSFFTQRAYSSVRKSSQWLIQGRNKVTENWGIVSSMMGRSFFTSLWKRWCHRPAMMLVHIFFPGVLAINLQTLYLCILENIG